MLRALVLCLTLALAAFSADKKVRAGSEKMTGCVDQRDGQYILTGSRMLGKMAALEAVGFEQEGFAKYVGNRVTVAGEKKGEGDTAVIRVRSIRQIAEGCVADDQAVK